MNIAKTRRFRHKPQTIYLECSSTLESGLNTGIQRIARNAAILAEKTGKSLGLECIPAAILDGKNLFRIEPEELRIKTAPLEGGIYGYFKRTARIAVPSSLYYFARKAKKAIFSGKDSGALSSMRAPVEFKDGDIILCLDDFWNLRLTRLVKTAKSGRNVAAIVLVHDIIPLTNPEFFDGELSYSFLKGYKNLEAFDGILTTSESNAKAIMEFNRQKRLDEIAEKPVAIFTPGSDIGLAAPERERNPSALTAAAVRPELAALTGNYIIIGTIEPRKNHELALDAFEAVWSETAPGAISHSLVIAGKPGWKCSKTLKRIKNSPYYGKKLFMFNDLSDAEIVFLYKNSKALIMPSMAEGFGLPMIEAMRFGLPVLASDIPVFRETGKEYPLFFSLKNPSGLYGGIKKLESSGAKTNNNDNGATGLNWDESIRIMVEKALELYFIL